MEPDVPFISSLASGAVVPIPTFPVDLETSPDKFCDQPPAELNGVNPKRLVISALVAFARTPEPFALSNVFPVIPLIINPVNDGDCAVPNPKFVLAVVELARSLKLFAEFSGA